MTRHPDDADRLRQAVALLLAGELVALPTETVYGLGADAANPEAVARIYAAKGRPARHPLIVHLPAAGHLAQWARAIPPQAHKLAAAFWPGPLTLILRKQDWVPLAVTGGQETVGLRVPAHPLAQALLAAFAAARAPAPAGIAAPSANRFGRVSPTTAAHVREELGAAAALILDGGPCAVGIESTIIDFSRATPEILRPGAIEAREIERVLGGAHLSTPSGPSPDAPRVSGALASHYAPGTPVRLVATDMLPQTLASTQAAGQRCALLCFAREAAGKSGQDFPEQAAAIRRMPDDPIAYARALYASLRELDHLGLDFLLIETPPTHPAWLAIHDRLNRAAG